MTSEIAPAGTSDIEASRTHALPEDISPGDPIIRLDRCAGPEVSGLVKELGLHPLAAQTLARRGLGAPAAAREWIAGAALHTPELIPGGPAAADFIAEHLGRDTRIAVHGDYDVDGVCSTAILVRALAALGADVTWHVPSRFEDGYGLSRRSISRLADDGVGLIIAVDCGIGSVAEVAYARELGVDMVICDHHTIGDVLPDAPIVHPASGDYPTPFLCAAATTHKLAALVTERVGADPATLDEDLALVALATVCDVVPLRGENRALVKVGLEQMRHTQRPGLRELMRVSGVDQLKIGAQSFGFALGPRINAVGRMHSAEPAVELMLTSSEARAAELAEQLASANRRRREVEQEILFDAETQAREQRDQFAIVVAGQQWHPGVLGIVAGRIAERYHRPTVALAIDGGVAAGSGRSGGAYDLHAGLASCADMLVRFGGHRAAAGLELDTANLDRFRAAFVRHAAEQLTLDDLRAELRVDAVAAPADINLEAASAIEALGPFGAENPEPRLLIAGAQLQSVSKLGRSGQHFKLSIAGGGSRASVVAFRQERVIAAAEPAQTVDLVVELQRNEYNGREEAQAVLCAIVEHDAPDLHAWRQEFSSAVSDPPATAGRTLDEAEAEDRRGEALLAVLQEFSVESTALALAVNDPLSWRAAVAGVKLIEPALKDLAVLAFDDPALAAGAFDHVVMAEPPPSPSLSGAGAARAVLAWNDAIARSVAARESDLLLSREHVVKAFRIVRDAGDPGESLLEELRLRLPSARIAGRAVRSLEELSVVRVQRSGADVEALHAADSPKTDLELSFTFRSYSEYREESQRWLRQISTERTSR
ncbi:MAG: single-stranded-DNA-specific exonuclease RecJ [Thermoleophilaceae bacterium]|nr:single-stranded-DNA-specific exonuclease RecJ [Thermoleophilaceae bacterium]